MSEWRETTLGEFVSLQRGHDLTEPERRPGIVPIMGSAGQNGCHDTALANGPGIVIGRSGASFGQVHCCMDDYWPHNTTLYVTNFHGNDPLFAYYLLKNINFSRYNSGSAQPSLNRNYIYHILISVPKPGTQRAIARFLGDLDDKIELNRKINQTLEQIAQAIFTSWFVDFEPVKAKIDAKSKGLDLERAAMCAISGKVDDELDQLPAEQRQQLAATAALFPDELVESELGLIPKEWEQLSLADSVQLLGGGTPKRANADFWGGDIPWFSVQDAPADGDAFIVDTKEKITTLGLEKSSSKLLPVGTTIISARGTVGRLALTGVEMAMNQSCYGVRGLDGIGDYFNYFNLKAAVSALQQNTHGAVFDTITRQTFETVSCVKPTKPLLDAFEETVAPLMATMRSNLFERMSLATLRDTLLPKLLSGEVSVGECK